MLVKYFWKIITIIYLKRILFKNLKKIKRRRRRGPSEARRSWTSTDMQFQPSIMIEKLDYKLFGLKTLISVSY